MRSRSVLEVWENVRAAMRDALFAFGGAANRPHRAHRILGILLLALASGNSSAQTCTSSNEYSGVFQGWGTIFSQQIPVSAVSPEAACQAGYGPDWHAIPRSGDPRYYPPSCDIPTGFMDGSRPLISIFACPYGGRRGYFLGQCVCNDGERFVDGFCQPVTFNWMCPIPSVDANPPEQTGGCGNPIAPGIGNKTQPEPLGVGRLWGGPARYNSQDSVAGTRLDPGRVLPFGAQWTTRFDARVVAITDKQTNALQRVGARRPGGSVVNYYIGTSSLVPAVVVRDRLVVQTAGGVRTGWINYLAAAPEIEIYGVSGALEQIVGADGQSLRLTYSTGTGGYQPASAPACQLPTGAPAASAAPRSGDLICVTDSFGRQLHFQYNAQRRVERSIEPDGGINTYRYDGPTAVVFTAPAGNLTTITYPDGTGRVFHYNEQANTGNVNRPTYLTGTSDDFGGGLQVRTGTYQYIGTFGVSTAGANGVNRYAFGYTNFGAPGQKTTVVDPLGTSRTLSYTQIGSAVRLTGTSQPGGAGCGPSSSAITYDANANVASRTDFNGIKTCYAYDLSRNLETRRVEGVAAAVDCATALTSPPTGARVISTQWHPDWRFETRIAEPSRITTLTYNGQGASCAPSTVLIDGKPPAVLCAKSEQATTDATGALGFGAGLTGTARTWRSTYTTYGRVLTATDPNGKVTTTTYYPDDDPDLGRRGNVATITNAANHVTRIATYNQHGQPTQIVDPNGLVTDLTYDLRMRLTSRKVGAELTTFTYGPGGLLTNVALPDGASLTYTYDAAHRLVAIADQQNNRIDYTLDALGNRISERASDSGGTLVKNIQRTIDALNRVQQIVGGPQ